MVCLQSKAVCPCAVIVLEESDMAHLLRGTRQAVFPIAGKLSSVRGAEVPEERLRAVLYLRVEAGFSSGYQNV